MVAHCPVAWSTWWTDPCGKVLENKKVLLSPLPFHTHYDWQLTVAGRRSWGSLFVCFFFRCKRWNISIARWSEDLFTCLEYSLPSCMTVCQNVLPFLATSACSEPLWQCYVCLQWHWNFSSSFVIFETSLFPVTPSPPPPFLGTCYWIPQSSGVTAIAMC